jgi:thiamine pyrophosphokinase
MKALIVADGDLPDRAGLDAAWPGWAEEVGLVVAADGGALGAARLGLAIDLLVGDMDSLPRDGLERLRAVGVEIEQARVDKDESDTELAVRAALARGAQRLTIVGAFGGRRIDHALANIGLLLLPELAEREAELIDARSRVTAVRAPDRDGRPVRRALPGRVGDLVSLLPFGIEARGVTTEGLRYPLRGGTLLAGPARGLSNVRLRPDAAVVVGDGILLIVETPATLAR